MTTALAYTIKTAAKATGISEDTIRRAIRAGDLATGRPTVDGKPITTLTIPAAELARWVEGRP